MEQNVLSDPLKEPNEEILFSIIGDKIILWQKILNYLHENHSNVTEVWRYYNDGKSWLFRTLNKKTTIYWIKVLTNTFSVAFYFSDKAESMIEESSLPENIKKDFKKAKKIKMGKGAIRSIAIEMKDSEDVENVIQLIELKLNMK
jgi:ABC-type uncharacterized transport system YnjBCD substrate-binding protein